jgi:DNA-directed RNA polymerase specialized sigma24 family protein
LSGGFRFGEFRSELFRGYSHATVTPTELELIAVRDADAVGRFYAQQIPAVREFCAELCPPQRIEEAVQAAMVNFLARATERPTDARPRDLLRKATREVAAGRMKLKIVAGQVVDPICLAMPELLAARANEELPGADGLVAEHLESCQICQATGARLEKAEIAFSEWSSDGPDKRAESGDLAETPTEREATPVPPPPSDPPRPLDQVGRVRGRRGGLVGAVRQIARARLDSQRRR